MTIEAARAPLTANNTDDHLVAMGHLSMAHESAVAGYWGGDDYNMHRKDVVDHLRTAARAYGFELIRKGERHES